MRLYIHPKSLRPEKRIYIPVLKRRGLDIRVRIIGRYRDKGIVRAVVEVEGDDELVRAVRKLGIKLTEKPIPAYFSTRVLAEISYTSREEYPIGIGELGEIIHIDVSAPVATDNIVYAFAIAEEPILWIDYKGDQTPLQYGFVEYEGLYVPRSPKKIHEIADILARVLKAKKDTIIGSLLGRKEVMEDIELRIADPLEDLRKWHILMDSPKKFGARNYIDFSGLPSMMLQVSLAIATVVWDGWMIINTPRAWGWIEDPVRYRARTLVVCDTAQGLNFTNIILEGKLIRKIRFLNKTVIIEKKFEPFWRLGE